MPITKSQGQTPTEKFLSELCDRTFLKLWSYANPFKADGKELCDLIAVFEDHIFLLFDRESRTFYGTGKDTMLTWKRWEREVVQKQIKTAAGAKRYVLEYPNEIYLDANRSTQFPIKISTNAHIHKLVIAHGAEEACKDFSDDNVYGSLGVSYGSLTGDLPFPFMLDLSKNDPVHVFDSHNLKIILGELDTFYDFVSYLEAKERAIGHFDFLTYCGEEDLLAHYFMNFDSEKKRHFIGVVDNDVNGLMIGEGEWKDFINSRPYKRKKEADRISYLWDDVIQRTCQNALDGSLLGDSQIFEGKSAIYEMAKEPRFSRRALSQHMADAIQRFPDIDGAARNLSFMPSFYKEKGYVFLQIKHANIIDYENDYRPKRQEALKIACGAAKNKFRHLQKVIGIAIDAPKFSGGRNSEDFILLNCDQWSDDDSSLFEKANRGLNFFGTKSLQMKKITVQNFPDAAKKSAHTKTGRNERCPCGSGKKFKNCCGR